MGRQVNPARARFNCIPRTYEGGCVYAVELSSGVVKVGVSRNPRTRMCALQNEVRRLFGAEIVRFHVGPDSRNDRLAFWREADLLERARRLACALPGKSEFFVGLPFNVARQLVEQVSRPHPSDGRRAHTYPDPRVIRGGAHQRSLASHEAESHFFA